MKNVDGLLEKVYAHKFFCKILIFKPVGSARIFVKKFMCPCVPAAEANPPDHKEVKRILTSDSVRQLWMHQTPARYYNLMSINHVKSDGVVLTLNVVTIKTKQLL